MTLDGILRYFSEFDSFCGALRKSGGTFKFWQSDSI